MSLYGLLDLVPVVGTVKNTVEGLSAAIVEGDGRKAVDKLTSAAVGGTLDVMTFGAGSSLLKLGAKGGVKIVAKKGAQITAKQVACNVAGRMAYSTASNVVDRAHIPYEDLARIRHQNRGTWGRDDDDGDDRRNNQNQRSSKRGEHVINNNVLNLYRDIVRTFVKNVMGDDLDTMIER